MTYSWHNIKKPERTQQIFSEILAHLFVKIILVERLFTMNEPQRDS